MPDDIARRVMKSGFRNLMTPVALVCGLIFAAALIYGFVVSLTIERTADTLPPVTTGQSPR